MLRSVLPWLLAPLPFLHGFTPTRRQCHRRDPIDRGSCAKTSGAGSRIGSPSDRPQTSWGVLAPIDGSLCKRKSAEADRAATP